ncbi:MAG: hypothetical protein JWO80_1058 [Bryobacterales bacterium]|nr:hypothetical protein [Bryobacterales bacterium]
MTYDPYQTYPTFGGYPGAMNPFHTPHTALQTSAINPTAAWNPMSANQGMSPGFGSSQWGQQGYPGVTNFGGINPQSQYAAAVPPQAIPQWPGLSPGLVGFQNGLQNPLLLLAQQLAAQQLVAQQLAAQQGAFGGQQFGLQPGQFIPQAGQYPHIGVAGQHIPPFALTGSPYGNQIGYPLAPQSWVGQANPVLLSQLTARALQAQGFPPGPGFPG